MFGDMYPASCSDGAPEPPPPPLPRPQESSTAILNFVEGVYDWSAARKKGWSTEDSDEPSMSMLYLFCFTSFLSGKTLRLLLDAGFVYTNRKATIEVFQGILYGTAWWNHAYTSVVFVHEPN